MTILVVLLVLSIAPAWAAAPPLRSADPVSEWNALTRQTIVATATDPFMASRALAIESIAVLDTVRSITGAPGFLVRLPAPRDLPIGPAVVAAAHTVLLHLYPGRQAALDAALAESLGRERSGAARDRAMAFGKVVARAVVAIRERDGWDATVDARDEAQPGQWRPSPPGFAVHLNPHWANLTPFAITAPSQFRPLGPPTIDTAAFEAAKSAVMTFGAAQSVRRTADWTAAARHWHDPGGSVTPAGHWNAIAAQILAQPALGSAAEAEVFAALNIALADAGIAAMDAKSTFRFWRPITAIRTGGAMAGAPQPDWSPLLDTLNHSSYVSGHATFSGAAAAVLTARFGERPFGDTSPGPPATTRVFFGFRQAAEEAAASRFHGGIHFAFDNEDGLALGRAVGAWTLGVFGKDREAREPAIVLDRVRGIGTTPMIAGFALDRLAPLTTLAVTLADGASFAMPVDARGRFIVPASRLAASAGRDIVLTARSVSGRTSVVRVTAGRPSQRPGD